FCVGPDAGQRLAGVIIRTPVPSLPPFLAQLRKGPVLPVEQRPWVPGPTRRGNQRDQPDRAKQPLHRPHDDLHARAPDEFGGATYFTRAGATGSAGATRGGGAGSCGTAAGPGTVAGVGGVAGSGSPRICQPPPSAR